MEIYVLIALALAVVILFVPRYGALASWRSWRAAQQRERLEDALKHLLDREQQGRHASPESLAGTLQVSSNEAMRLINEMTAQKLIENRGMEIHLTAEGERWAIHIVRAHRLWERYLADEARMPLGKVHSEAHRREHAMTDAEIDALDAALGHPTRDPHGDPIPNREGKIAAQDAIPLTAAQTDGVLRISHIEDEPSIAFDQIMAAGLRLGQTIRVIEKTSERYVISDGESEYRLAPSVAANVQVTLLQTSKLGSRDVVPLWKLNHDQRAEIISLDEGVQGFTRRRFLDLGLTPGTTIQPELQNFFGDPRGYRVRGTLIALRKDQAAQIWVKPV